MMALEMSSRRGKACGVAISDIVSTWLNIVSIEYGAITIAVKSETQ